VVEVDHDDGVLGLEAPKDLAQCPTVGQAGQRVDSGIPGKARGAVEEFQGSLGVSHEGREVAFEEHSRYPRLWRSRKDGFTHTERHVDWKGILRRRESRDDPPAEHLNEVTCHRGHVGRRLDP
jgi:hypothetical protein